ncbi:hypothetical protein I601_3535 [Nocardioides dokdonensis FR1436]|uniref:Uncharacterized protein n=1 Tax=Nocardioides dokdonensis FR1436 TaxID=1300347 RepID=A0A1A9GR41_9ACTN|nr:hypothetical protein [Nocardioides dokdonensis]ANH39941.1 hypothetical protein I601_3535 [Nocardioides dokdonensis FR1436]
MTEKTHRLEIDWLKTVAGALAAISSAVLLSTLGAAGTIAGAAIGSVVLSTGSAIYSQGLARSRERLARAQSTALRRVGVSRADVEALVDEPDRLPWRERLARLPWKRIGLYAAGFFLAAVVAISAFEVIAGRSVASYTGGDDNTGDTTFSKLVGGGSDTPDDEPTGPGERPEDSDPDAPAPTTPQPDDTSSGTPEESSSPAPETSTSPTPEPVDPVVPTDPVPSAPTVAPQE